MFKTNESLRHLYFENLNLFRISIFGFRIFPQLLIIEGLIILFFIGILSSAAFDLLLDEGSEAV